MKYCQYLHEVNIQKPHSSFCVKGQSAYFVVLHIDTLGSSLLSQQIIPLLLLRQKKRDSSPIKLLSGLGLEESGRCPSNPLT
ncbi:hypothetical protein, partial [Leptolyngbya sp. FACHB-711]|uniref:hypothetical protein n=1 Tax=Leptolyngbya sp. FACHB-711 TaxID=2692813 RepID=UPI001A7E35CB